MNHVLKKTQFNKLKRDISSINSFAIEENHEKRQIFAVLVKNHLIWFNGICLHHFLNMVLIGE